MNTTIQHNTTQAPLKSNRVHVYFISPFFFPSNAWICFPSLLVYSMIFIFVFHFCDHSHNFFVEIWRERENRKKNIQWIACLRTFRSVKKDLLSVGRSVMFFPPILEKSDWHIQEMLSAQHMKWNGMEFHNVECERWMRNERRKKTTKTTPAAAAAQIYIIPHSFIYLYFS